MLTGFMGKKTGIHTKSRKIFCALFCSNWIAVSARCLSNMRTYATIVYLLTFKPLQTISSLQNALISKNV